MRILAILAGGRGERLKPLTETRPKAVLPVLDEPLVCRHVRLASSYSSFDKVVVVVSYEATQVARALEECGIEAELVNQGGELGTGDAIAKAMEAGGPGDYTLIYGDVYVKEEVYELLSKLRAPSVLLAEARDPSSYGVARVSPDGFLESIVEKPSSPLGSSLVFAGLLKLSYEHSSFFKNLKASPRGELEATDALNEISKSYEVKVAVAPRDSWVDVGRPWDFLRANIMALSELREQVIEGDVSEKAEISGPVLVKRGSSIKPYTVIEGPAYVGEEAVVGPLAHVRGYTVIGKRAFIGAFTELKASVVLERARLPHLNYAGDSVIGEYANLGAGTKIANLRFDEQEVEMTVKGVRVKTGLRKLGAVIGGYAKTGINVSIMPGVKIGSYAIIYPGCVVSRDVERGEVLNCWSR
ncbi:MAG: sugar phosphate nucleotidyltransferase [Acidilobaceae archaeon]